MAAVNEASSASAPRRRGRPRKYPIDAERPRKRLRYTIGATGRRNGGTPYSRADADEHPHTTGRIRPTRRPYGSGAARRRLPLTPSHHADHEATSEQPRYSSAAAAASAISQNDTFKPREERSWEEFHADLDIDIPMTTLMAEDVDANQDSQSVTPSHGAANIVVDATPIMSQALQLLKSRGFEGTGQQSASFITPIKRGPGRPPKRPQAILYAMGFSPTPQKITPAPIHNPKEKLVLPKPNYREVQTFTAFEQSEAVSQNYVDKSLANVGYQESEIFLQSRSLIRGGKEILEDDIDSSMPADDTLIGSVHGPRFRVEYDMDEQDAHWLEGINAERKAQGAPDVGPQHFEITMTLIEKEWYAMEKRIPKPNPKPPQTHRPRSSSAAAVNGEPAGAEEQDSKCAVCDDGDCENTNAIVFCDGCDLAVHQECYGVPFIPEGQWLCRKCQLIGRAAGSNAPACIFCPNTEGAFKQTTNMRWSHLLCAIWIPEVSLGNHTFMEPVQDVEKVPKSRWKLNCYICQQRMGACIQCSNKNCYLAFHVTCARRCRLSLKMKNQHGQIQDAGALMGYCDKHVSPEWREEHDSDRATAEARAYYQREMKGRRWTDSQQAALSLPDPSQMGYVDPGEDMDVDDPVAAAARNKKRKAVMKKTWRMPSGAPIVPQVVFDNVEKLLGKWQLRKRKEFVAEACKYWTLKREARRGASLLKRLQLQLDTFTSMEITRRDFAAMGATGGLKLQSRIDFAKNLELDLSQISKMCDKIVEREAVKLGDAEILHAVVNTVYFPTYPLLWTMFNKLVESDENHNYFSKGFKGLKAKLDSYGYTSIVSFTEDVVNVLNRVVFSPDAADEPVGIPGGQVNVSIPKIRATDRDKKARARAALKKIQTSLLAAAESEAELENRSRDDSRQVIQAMLDSALHQHSTTHITDNSDVTVQNGTNTQISTDQASTEDAAASAIESEIPGMNSKSSQNEHVASVEIEAITSTGTDSRGPAANDTEMQDADAIAEQLELPALNNGLSNVPPLSNSGSTNPSTTYHEPLTPTHGDKDVPVIISGGVPWYLELFEPDGTTIYEERWTGPEKMRELSEELSELDDDAVNELLASDNGKETEIEQEKLKVPVAVVKKKVARSRRKRW